MQPDRDSGSGSLTTSIGISGDASDKEKVNVVISMTSWKSLVFTVNIMFGRVNGRLALLLVSFSPFGWRSKFGPSYGQNKVYYIDIRSNSSVMKAYALLVRMNKYYLVDSILCGNTQIVAVTLRSPILTAVITRPIYSLP